MEKIYPAPRKGKEFKKYWAKFLPKVIERENFHQAHLETLIILCDLYVDYHILTKFIKENGWTYEGDGRYGASFKEFPQCKLRQKCVSDIRAYSKTLGLVLAKDSSKKESTDDDWG